MDKIFHSVDSFRPFLLKKRTKTALFVYIVIKGKMLSGTENSTRNQDLIGNTLQQKFILQSE